MLYFHFFESISWCTPGCPGSHSVGHAVLELTQIRLPHTTWLGCAFNIYIGVCEHAMIHTMCYFKSFKVYSSNDRA